MGHEIKSRIRRKILRRFFLTYFPRLSGTSTSRPKHFKVEVVALDDKQVAKRYYKNIYALVVDFSICVLVLIFAYIRGWPTRHVDMKAAFINGNILTALYL